MSTVITRDITVRQGAEYRDELRRYSARYRFEAANAGTSDAAAPTFPVAIDSTVVDNDITWVNKGVWAAEVHPEIDVWLASRAYARRAKIVTPVVPVDLTGYTGAFQLRSTVDSDTVIYDGTVGFAGTRSNGEFEMVIPTADTATFTFTSAVYDLELSTSGGEVNFVLRGNVTLIKEVTRA